jgi:ubiquinone biosynthesis protein COQ4
MATMAEDVPYLMRGVTQIPTESSVLVSSSRYLNDPDLREWIAFIMLRRNGPDCPPELEMADLEAILPKAQGRARLEELVAAERCANPRFNAWLDAARRPRIVRPASFPEGSLGARLPATGGQSMPTPAGDGAWLVASLRARFDIERLLIGAGLDHFGEMTTHFFRLANLFKTLQPELAGELGAFHILGALRFLPRTILHYPQLWLTGMECMTRGDEIGLTAPALFMEPLDELLLLTVSEARARVGLGGVVDVDTWAASAEWAETVGGASPDRDSKPQ